LFCRLSRLFALRSMWNTCVIGDGAKYLNGTQQTLIWCKLSWLLLLHSSQEPARLVQQTNTQQRLCAMFKGGAAAEMCTKLMSLAPCHQDTLDAATHCMQVPAAAASNACRSHPYMLSKVC
jgi:hypothetical protein